MNDKLAAIVITRHRAAAAIFSGTQLHYVENRVLSSAPPKAANTLLAFIGWLMEEFKMEAVVLQVGEVSPETHTGQMIDMVESSLKERSISLWRVRKTDLLDAYAHPRLANQKQLRLVATSIWPHLIDTQAHPLELDAATLGLYMQTERLLHS